MKPKKVDSPVIGNKMRENKQKETKSKTVSVLIGKLFKKNSESKKT